MKRIILLAIACITSTLSYSATIDCYQSNSHIYHGHGKNIFYGDGYISFIDKKNGHLMVAYANCLIKYDIKETQDITVCEAANLNT